MRRHLTNLINLVAGVSFALWVGLVVGWVRSGFRADNVEGTLGRRPGAPYVSFVSNSGEIAAAYMHGCPWPQPWEWTPVPADPSQRRWLSATFRLQRKVMNFVGLQQGAAPVPANYFNLAVPYWAAVVLAAAVPGWRVWGWSRRRRRRFPRAAFSVVINSGPPAN